MALQQYVHNKIKKISENYASIFTISTKLTDDNVCYSLETAMTVVGMVNGNDSLKNKSLEYIGRRMGQVLATNQFLNVPQNVLREILLINDTGMITEYEIFTFVMLWATRKCESNNEKITGINKRIHLGDIVKLIRFPIMSMNDFNRCITEELGLLTVDEENSIILSILTKTQNRYGFIINPRTRTLDLSKQTTHNLFLGICGSGHWSKISPNTNHGRTIFTVNHNVYITKLDIGKPRSTQYVTIKLINDQKLTIYEQRREIESSDEYTLNWITFQKPILIEGRHEYTLDVNYDNPHSPIYYSLPQVNFPMIIKQRDCVEFQFIKLSQLLWRILYKNG